jgi:hypothetical protein
MGRASQEMIASYAHNSYYDQLTRLEERVRQA